MNYLAHLVLSGKNEEVIFGNFIADAVKGKSYLSWSKNIQKGILLHRFIDHYTDTNPHYLAGKRRFYEKFPKMGGVINDILYDYLLWQYELKYKNIQLDKEIIGFYRTLDGFQNKMPKRILYMYQYMKKDDWLTNYQYKHGVKKALHGIGKRIKYSDNLESCFDILESSIFDFEKEFEMFYHEIKEHTSSFYVN
ncbi:MAG: ACP phosphodiesterase [Flavobacteriales bacterium]